MTPATLALFPLWADDDPGEAVCLHGVDILGECAECEALTVELEGQT